MSCSICLEDYKGRVKRVQCQYCPAAACCGCQQKVLLNSYEDPACFSCKRGWSAEFMAASFPMSFRGTTLRLHRRKVLFEREKTVLPALQIYVEYKRDSERLAKACEALTNEIGQEYSRVPTNMTKPAFLWRQAYEEQLRTTRMIQGRIAEIVALKADRTRDPENADIAEKLRVARADRDQFKTMREAVRVTLETVGPDYIQKRSQLRELQREYGTAQANYDGREIVRERREFIMRCPAEECRGFLSSAYKCGTCESWACKECLVCIGKDHRVEHTCNPDTVESAKAIRAETRPCPKCGTRIFKAEGCDQMWCVMDGCGTAFSWNTGHIVTGVIHNPHYYEWLRRNGGAAGAPREAGDIPCGGMPTTWQFVRAMHDLEIPNEIKAILMETFRNMQELVAERLGGYPARMPQLMNKEDDVAYLMNRLTEDEWKRRLELSEAKFNRKKEIGQILQTLVTAGSDMMNRLFEKAQEADDEPCLDITVGWILDTCIPELEQLRAFGNESLRALAARDKMAVPQFEENWKWKGARALYRVKKIAVTEIVEESLPTS
jgi:hypothetical protein